MINRLNKHSLILYSIKKKQTKRTDSCDFASVVSAGNSREGRVFTKKVNNLLGGSLWWNGFSSTTSHFSLFSEFKFCSFLAQLTIPLHLSLTSCTDLAQTLSAFTFCFISSHISFFSLFVSTLQNLLFMTNKFFSASSRMTAHAAAVKLAFLFLFAVSSAIILLQ